MTMMTELTGYLASAMVLLTFMTKDMRLLRILAIFSNVAFITYGFLVWLPPVLYLHLLLLPVNTLRLCNLLAEEGRRLQVPGWLAVTKFVGAGRQVERPERAHPSQVTERDLPQPAVR